MIFDRYPQKIDLEGDKNGCEDAILWDDDDDDIEHIAVIVDRQQFVLFTRRPDNNSSALPAPEIAQQLAKVRKIARNRMRDSVQPVGGAGTGPRDKAAEFWAEMKQGTVEYHCIALIGQNFKFSAIQSSLSFTDPLGSVCTVLG